MSFITSVFRRLSGTAAAAETPDVDQDALQQQIDVLQQQIPPRNPSGMFQQRRRSSGSAASEIPKEEPIDAAESSSTGGGKLDAATTAAGGGVAGEIPSSAGGGAPSQPRISIKATPEYHEATTDAKPSFYVSVNLKYEEMSDDGGAEKMPLDLVCILDTSGSMGGGKIESLNKAMKFVVGCLGPRDRLSVVKFESESVAISGLIKMTAENKTRMRGLMDTHLRAGGGTNILAGMELGWSVLTSRTTWNPTSCVFLLTDGQDKDNLERKLALAREIKASGSSLLVFGFGADHDSEHMTEIANAAEDSFT